MLIDMKPNDDFEYWSKKISLTTQRIEALARHISWAKNQELKFRNGERKHQRSCVRSRNNKRVDYLQSRLDQLYLKRLHFIINLEIGISSSEKII